MKIAFKKTGHYISSRAVLVTHHQRIDNGRWTTVNWTYRDYTAPTLQELLTLI